MHKDIEREKWIEKDFCASISVQAKAQKKVSFNLY